MIVSRATTIHLVPLDQIARGATMQIGNGGLSGDCSLKREETDARLHTKALLGGVAALAAMVLASGQAHATLALTADGVADGFTLTTFVSGYNFGSIYGPLGQGILPNSNVVTGSL